MDMKRQFVSSKALIEFSKQAFVACGVDAEAAQVTARHLIGADMRGVDTHGIVRLPLYISRIRRGLIAARAEPIVVRESATTAVMDAQNALGQWSANQAMNRAIEKARDHDLGAVTVRHSNHYGAAAEYSLLAAEQGMIGITTTNTAPLMPPKGGAARRVGNNPLSIGVPSELEAPLTLDIAFSVVAAWNLMLAHQRGEKVPLGWALDSEGNPTDDPYEGFVGGGTLLPIADHKGFGLAMMMDILTGVLSGGHFGNQTRGLKSDEPVEVCHFMLAINVEAFMPIAQFHERISQLVALMKATPRAEGVNEIMVPGEPEHRKFLIRQAEGIGIEEALVEELRTMADELGIRSLEC
jgi:LDH2 family malate/lactate/ureidoglycolate dehydrogenase